MAVPQYTPQELENETWLNIIDYEGFYLVSDMGRIKAVKTGIVLKPCYSSKRFPNGKGYAQVSLSKYGVNKSFLSHKLTMRAFVGNTPQGYEINHIDGDKGNSRLTNLEFVTPEQNRHHADKVLNVLKPTRARGLKNGRHTHPERTARGERSGRAKLTKEIVVAIRAEYRPNVRGFGHKSLAKKYGISIAHARVIVKGLSWQHIL